jgi:DNA-binding transcriptional LysR family regulator
MPAHPLIEDWDDLRIVLAIAEHGTLSGAAIALKVSHPTLTRRLKRIEQRMGLTLFERTAHGLRLTEAGADMHSLAEGWRLEIGELERRLAGRDRRPAGPVRITAPDAVAEYLLPDILAHFSREHPDILVELNVSSAVLSLAQREADIAIRITDLPGPSLVGWRMGTVGMAVYAERRLAASLTSGRPRLPQAGPVDWGQRLRGLHRVSVEHPARNHPRRPFGPRPCNPTLLRWRW